MAKGFSHLHGRSVVLRQLQTKNEVHWRDIQYPQEISQKEYTADQAIEAVRHLMVPGTYGWESQTLGLRWRQLLEAHPEYRHLKPTIEGEP